MRAKGARVFHSAGVPDTKMENRCPRLLGDVLRGCPPPGAAVLAGPGVDRVSPGRAHEPRHAAAQARLHPGRRPPLRTGRREQLLRPRKRHIIKPGLPFVSANRTDSPLHWLAFYAERSVNRGAAPGGSTQSLSYESEDLVGLRDGPYDLLLLRAEWQPGARTALHHHPGPVMVHLLERTVAHTDEGVTRTIKRR